MAQALPTCEDVSAEMAAQMAVHVAAIEQRLSELDKAFASGDGDVIARQAQQLQMSLAESLVSFRKAGQAGLNPLTEALRSRLKLAQSRVLAQQAAVHRANAAFERTLNVLLPREDNNSATYGKLGQSPVAKALNAYS